MNIDITKTLELILSICALVGIAWKVFQTIDKIDRRLELHMLDSTNKHESLNLITHQLNEKIDHKFRRLLAGQQDIQKYLVKDGFVIREYFDPKDEQGR